MTGFFILQKIFILRQVKIGIFNMIGISLYNVHNCLHKSKNPLRLKVKGSYFQAVYLSVANGERTLFSFIFYEKRISLSIEIITKNKFRILYPLLNKKHSRSIDTLADIIFMVPASVCIWEAPLGTMFFLAVMYRWLYCDIWCSAEAPDHLTPVSNRPSVIEWPEHQWDCGGCGVP